VPDQPIDPTWFVRPDGRDASRTIHGLGHTARVLTHALEIADALGLASWEWDALECAAAWHDIGRTNDSVDYYHGAKSAGKVVGLGLHAGVDPLAVETALFAVTHHCGSEMHAEPAAERTQNPEATLRVFRVLKDADALDRVRLGDLGPSYLRFDVSKARVDRAWELLRELP
jgi:HD superfamily phosphodiesterase